MSKLVVVQKGKVVAEWQLGEKETVIGRGSDCSVTLDDTSVSRHHAKVMRIYTGYFIEDLHSTNGVVLNGRRVRKHMLKGGDIIQIGESEVKFVEEDAGDSATDTDEMAATPPAAPQQFQETVVIPPTEQTQEAHVRYLTGPDQGNSRLVDKPLYTIGQPGGNLAVISRRAHGYFLMHLGGDRITMRNGEEVLGAGVVLASGDQIQVGDIQLEFYTGS